MAADGRRADVDVDYRSSSFASLTEAGEGPIMRTLWARDASGWRITAYRVEYP
jgi:hypothetical protein